jgi:hemolysin activation/secretion protein
MHPLAKVVAAASLPLALLLATSGRGAEVISPAAAPDATLAAEPAAAAAPDPRTLPHFDIWEYRVLGNSALPGKTIEQAMYPLLGPGKTINDVEAARQTLERSYRDAGYATVFVDIPEQQVESGVVRLKVTEGKVDRVRITGTRYFSNGQIRASLPALQSGTVPNLPKLQAQLAELNAATADRSVIPVLKAGRTPGTVDVNLKVQDALPLHGSVELNDRYTANTTRLRLGALVSYGNLFQLRHALTLQLQASPQKLSESRAIIASYVLPLPGLKNTSLALYAVDSKSDVAALGTIAVLGTGQVYGTRIVYAPLRTPQLAQTVTLGLDYKSFLENIRLKNNDSLKTPIHYLNWSAAYALTRNRERSTTVFDVTANFGVRGLINDSTEFADKRFSGPPNYFYLRGNTQYSRPLSEALQLYSRLALQWSTYALVSNEQLAIGGLDTVRGYTEATELGDYGADATVELRDAWLSKLLHLAPGAAYGFAFLDGGRVVLVDPLALQTTEDLASTGLGLRINAWHGFSSELEWAVALRSAAAIRSGDQRAHFNFKWAF